MADKNRAWLLRLSDKQLEVLRWAANDKVVLWKQNDPSLETRYKEGRIDAQSPYALLRSLVSTLDAADEGRLTPGMLDTDSVQVLKEELKATAKSAEMALDYMDARPRFDGSALKPVMHNIRLGAKAALDKVEDAP